MPVERGSQTLTVERTGNEHPTAPHNKKDRKPPQKVTFSILGNAFRGIEGMTSEQMPDATFHYYEEEKGNLNIKIIEFGLGNPTPADRKKPIPLRLDYGCPCMEMPLDGHDCARQRDITLETMQKMGRGVLVLIDPKTSSGMGHGEFDVMNNYLERQKAALQGGQIPSITDYFNGKGVKDIDKRQHSKVASVIERFLKGRSYDPKETPVVLLGSSPKKIKSLEENGVRIDSIARVNTASGADPGKAKLGYGTDEKGPEGVFLEAKNRDGADALLPLIDIISDYERLRENIIFDRSNQN
jgi:hypothetical protein